MSESSLVPERQLVFSPGLAATIGLEEAILLQHLQLQFDHLESHIGKIIDGLVQDFTGVALMALADDSAALHRLTRYLQSILTCKVLQFSTAAVVAGGVFLFAFSERRYQGDVAAAARQAG